MLLFIADIPNSFNAAALFQNISCYCLSDFLFNHQRAYADFKTSHVIVYPDFAVYILFCAVNFKTSHVIVYLPPTLIPDIPVISKHLMLLFIPRISAFFSFSPPLFPLIFSIFLHFLPANTLILDRPTYHPINLLIFQAFLDFSFFFRLVKIL